MRDEHGNVETEVARDRRERMEIGEARRWLHRAVVTQGDDFVYSPVRVSCYYNPKPDSEVPAQRKTGCLIGTALKLAGIDVTRFDIEAPEGVNITTLTQRFRDALRLTREATTYLQIAQDIQDQGRPWGEAYRAAEAYYNAYNRANTKTFGVKEY